MNKIEALEKTIYNLENDLVEYEWTSSKSCNCGVLAKTVLNGGDIYKAGFLRSPSLGHDYTSFANHAYCMTTGLELPELFQSLKDAGFTFQELLGLENLSGENVIKRLGWQTYSWSNRYNVVYRGHSRSDKQDLITYLKAWVEILKDEQPIIETPPTPEEPKVKEIIRYVSVPQSITEQSKELILS
jgi:hypothetical protein